MEAETPRRWVRRPEVRPPDGDDDGVTELDAGAEIDVGNGRPERSAGRGRKQKRRRPNAVGKTAPRSSRWRRSMLGAVLATANTMKAGGGHDE